MSESFMCVPDELWSWEREDWALAFVRMHAWAARSAKEVRTNGQAVSVHRGELLTSVAALAHRLGWTDKAARVFLAHLEVTGRIAYPEGKNHRRLFRVRLTPFWRDARGERKGGRNGTIRGESNPYCEAQLAEGRARAGARGRAEERATVGKKEREQEISLTGDQEGATESRALVLVGKIVGDEPDPNRVRAGDLLGAWIRKQPGQVANADRDKQAGAAKWLVEHYSRDELLRAFVGMDQLFPYSRGDPWDLYDLKAKMAKAGAAAMNHPQVKQAQAEAEFDNLTRGAA